MKSILALSWAFTVSALAAPPEAAGPPQEDITPKAAACIAALADVSTEMRFDNIAPGRLPQVVEFKKPAGPLAFMSRLSGELLVSDGKMIYSAPRPEGKLNGYAIDRAEEWRTLKPSLFRRIAVPDGRTVDYHRMGDAKNAVDFIRKPNQQEQLLEADRDMAQRKLTASLSLVDQYLTKFEKTCDEATDPHARSQVKGLAEMFTEMFAFKPLEGGRRETPMDAKIEVEGGMAEDFAKNAQNERRNLANLDTFKPKLEGLEAERKKKENTILTKPVQLNAEALKELVKEQIKDFDQGTNVDKLSVAQRAQLSGTCAAFWRVPAAPVAAPKEKTFADHVEDSLPDASKPFYKAFKGE